MRERCRPPSGLAKRRATGAVFGFVTNALVDGCRVATALVPILQTAMDAGLVARRDPVVVAEWLSRLAITSVLAPPPGDLHAFLAELLVPALEP